MFCDNNGLRKLPRQYPEDVETIHFRENGVRKVRFVHLHGLYQLKHLILKGNRVSYVEPKALIDLYHLVSLSLTDNNLRYLSPDTFKSQSRLQVLSLRHNKLRGIEKLFWPLGSLRLLNLAHNRIKAITHKTFRGNYQLRVLDLNDNNIKNIHKYAFKQMPFLRFLVLRDNPLRVVELDFRQNFHLELLDFTNCRLSEVVKGMPFSINDLRLSENNITKINKDDFKTIRKVRLMVLNDNQLKYIHPLAFAKLWQLYALYIGANQLNNLPPNLPKTISAIYANYNVISRVEADDLSYRPQMHTILLKHNNITHIDQEAFKGLFSLENLDLRDNKIHMMRSMMFKDNILMQKLDLSSNPIKEMDHDCFNGLTNLNILVMSSVGNESNIQPSIFKDTRKLQFLDLSNSSQLAKQITTQPAVLEYIKSVEDLNLMEDDLDTLPKDFPGHFPRLRMVKLSGNPWHCDHNLLWMRDWLHNRSIEFFSPHEMVCVSPPHLSGMRIKDLTENDAPTPWTASIDQPVINLVNISYNHNDDKSQKVFLGRDGKWYYFNTALSRQKGGKDKAPGRKGAGKYNAVLAKGPLKKRPQPPYVRVKPVKSYDSKTGSPKRKRKGKGKTGRKNRGKQVAALNAVLPDAITRSLPSEKVTNNMDTNVHTTWKPAPPLLQTPISDKGGNNDNSKDGSRTLQTAGTKSKTGETMANVLQQSVQQPGNEDNKLESTGGSPLYDDSSGLVSGEEYIDA